MIQLVPLVRPEILTVDGVPAVVHASDFTRVTTASPARPGEILSLFVTGLGPTRAALAPGTPFPSNPLANVSSPVEVTVNGAPAEVTAAVGFPRSVDGYQVNFRVPGTASTGTATLQVSAAWIPGSAVNIAVQQ